MSGEYMITESGKRIAFTWFGKGDPAPSEVEVIFAEQDGGTLISLDHSSLGSGDEWSESIAEIKKGWKNALENLASVVKSGEDIRFVSRPMLGITLDEFNEQIAKKLGLPITKGVRLGGTIDGMGAAAAGLQQNDIIVSMGGKQIVDFETIDKTLNSYRAGDTIEVIFYRDSEKQSVMMTLSGRPIPEIPPTAQGLSEAVAVLYKDIEMMLDDFLAGVSDEEASFKPSQSEWSIKGNIAHFIQGERFWLQYIVELISGHMRFADDYGGNVNEEIEATIAVYPTVQDLVEEYKHKMAETLYLLAHLPADFVANKGAYWQLAYNLLQDPYHFNTHLEQMKTALEAARNQ
jgi:membrane-associated protease RseP (regulator of RpoE activity)